jgi:hypothetical protein
MKLVDLGISHEQLFIVFQKVKTHLKSKEGIEFKSKTYNTLRILNHKGYIYFWEYKESECIKYKGLNVDGIRFMPSAYIPNEMYVEIHADGGDSSIANPESFNVDLPINVINLLLDSLKPNFVENDIY